MVRLKLTEKLKICWQINQLSNITICRLIGNYLLVCSEDFIPLYKPDKGDLTGHDMKGNRLITA
jgi:hypothetical protein